MSSQNDTHGLKVKIFFTSIFEKYLTSVKTTKTILKSHLIRLLEGKFRKGEVLLPNKDLGGSLILLKGRIEEKNISDRFLSIIYVNNIYVMPVFIIDKTSKLGSNIGAHNPIYYQIAKQNLLSLKDKKYTVDYLNLSTEKITLPNGIQLPKD